jgi:hypothetical protein
MQTWEYTIELVSEQYGWPHAHAVAACIMPRLQQDMPATVLLKKSKPQILDLQGCHHRPRQQQMLYRCSPSDYELTG